MSTKFNKIGRGAAAVTMAAGSLLAVPSVVGAEEEVVDTTPTTIEAEPNTTTTTVAEAACVATVDLGWSVNTAGQVFTIPAEAMPEGCTNVTAIVAAENNVYDAHGQPGKGDRAYHPGVNVVATDAEGSHVAADMESAKPNEEGVNPVVVRNIDVADQGPWEFVVNNGEDGMTSAWIRAKVVGERVAPVTTTTTTAAPETTTTTVAETTTTTAAPETTTTTEEVVITVPTTEKVTVVEDDKPEELAYTGAGLNATLAAGIAVLFSGLGLTWRAGRIGDGSGGFKKSRRGKRKDISEQLKDICNIA